MSAKLVSVMFLLLLPALAEAQPVPVRCHGPLSEAQLTDMVKGSVPAPRIGQFVTTCGIDFEPAEDVIGRLRSAGAPETVLAAVRSATGPAERKRKEEQAFWESIKDSQDAAVFEDYIRRYPEGQFAEPARKKYRDLKVSGMRAEMERTLEAGQWDAADEKVLDLLRVVSADDEIRGWQQRVADGREAGWRRERRISDLRTAIPSDLQAKLWAIAEQSLTELLSLVPGDSQAMQWQSQVTEGRSKEEAEKHRLAIEEEGHRRALELANEFIAIRPGTFVTDEKHLVRITKGFEMGKYEVTQGQWEAVMGSNPSQFKAADGPVENVSWEDAQEFLTRMNKKGDRYLYRLPSDAEWEYAARAGEREKPKNLDAVAWYDQNSGGKTHAVGQKQANAWGLHDMLGNVWEWCQDRAPGPGTGTFFGVVRGGSWGSNGLKVSVDFRDWREPSFRDYLIGFRCVRERLAAPTKLSEKDLAKMAKRADAAYARQDYATAAPLYQQLADAGRASAMVRLGAMYETGQGVAQDDVQAVAWLRKASENGNSEGMVSLGWMYLQGRGVAQDSAQAADWFRKAAEKGEPSGMTNLGVMYANGSGVAQDYSQALAWYGMAAEKGEPLGMNNLGTLYLNGRGVAQDDIQAVAWFRMAAEKGEPTGMTNLGAMYAEGRGVVQDDAQAVAWIRKAAEKGEPTGMFLLGAMYEEGQGVAQDDTQAVAWYRKAAALGNEDAKERLKSMENPRRKKLTKKTTAVRVH